MSWYRIVLTLSIVFSTLLSAKELMVISDDELIMRGLLYDEYRAYENSRQVYASLFDATNAEVYLFKEATASLLGKTHMEESIQRLKKWNITHPDALESHRLLIPLYLTCNKVDLAKSEAENLLERSKNPVDIELASNPFLYTGEFKRALTLLNKVYEAMPKEMVLLRMADIMDEYTGERKKAIQLLETHRRIGTSSSKEILAKLLVMYSKDKDIDGLMETYKALYELDQDYATLAKIIDTYAYKRDVNGAIAYLEQQKAGSDILYELYKGKELFDKALVIAQKRFAKSKDPIWLAEKAILLFENAKDKDDTQMINEVVSHFEKAIALGVDDSIYLNYYGYTLIDKGVDIEKSMDIIQNALLQQPNNTYYLDSLAWGHYKKHECLKAFNLMKQVVLEEGLEEVEIVEHWDAIKQCK